MATVRLSDVFIPNVYLGYQTVNNIESLQLSQSGVLVRNEALDAKADAGSRLVDVPFWKDLDQTIEPNYSNDDPADHSVPNKIGTGDFFARNAYLNQSYSSMDLTAELLSQNPLERIRNRFGVYWQRQLQRRLIAQSVGIYLNNIASNGGDMVFQVPTLETGAAPAANKKFSRANFTAAAFTLGDAVESISTIAVHSAVMKTMTDNDDIDFIPDSKGDLTIPTYLGRRVIVDDTLPVRAGTTSGLVYTSILFGQGQFGLGVGSPENPAEVARDPSAGDGGGMETIWERKTWLMHPFGFSWLEAGAAITEFSPTLADLKLAAHWSRVVPRKAVAMAFLDTNG